MPQKRILIAPLNWGLGHATRCIPVINALLEQDFVPVIASDGAALQLLKKEFPNLEHFALPSYNIKYSRKGTFFGIKLLHQTPHILKTISAERKIVDGLVDDLKLDGIISDNRWGVRTKKIPCVFITHQINVLSGVTTWISSKIQQQYIQKFDECWVPDSGESLNLSGKMGHGSNFPFRVKYLGILSRLEKISLPAEFDITVILSGPEPQRSFLEFKLKKELLQYPGKVLFVRGIIENEQEIKKEKNITTYNFLTTGELQQFLNSSKMVICRPGYTSLMDLSKLGTKVFFIPTPGQYEQEYLAKRLNDGGVAPSCSQNDFNLEKLDETGNYKGLGTFDLTLPLTGAFTLFKGE